MCQEVGRRTDAPPDSISSSAGARNEGEITYGAPGLFNASRVSLPLTHPGCRSSPCPQATQSLSSFAFIELEHRHKLRPAVSHDLRRTAADAGVLKVHQSRVGAGHEPGQVNFAAILARAVLLELPERSRYSY